MTTALAAAITFAGALDVDCYYHTAVPSVGVCHDCLQTICATCRDEQGICPGCRLERRMNAAGAPRSRLSGGRRRPNPPPGPEPAPEPQAWTPARRPAAAVATISPETRALLALGYPLWPLAALALLDPKRSPAVRRHATQALAVNFGLFALWVALETLVRVPLLGLSAWPLLTFLFPVWFVASVFYGFKVWHGDDVRVPLVSDWLDERDHQVSKNPA